MDDGSVDIWARQVVECRLTGRPLSGLFGPAREGDGALELGYAVQAAANRALEARLGRRVGHKIGGTTGEMRDYLGVSEPLAGEVFEAGLVADGVTLRRADYRRPGVETEIAVRLGRGLPPRPQPYGRDEVTSAVDAVMAAIEIVDDRYEDFRSAGGAVLVADNAFNAACVVGPAVRGATGLDLARLEGRTVRDDRVVARGQGAMLMGHPLDALAWLATRRSRLGTGLKAGTLVSLGSITPVQWVDEPGDYRVEFDRLGSVAVRFA